jgi:hypothetical protein
VIEGRHAAWSKTYDPKRSLQRWPRDLSIPGMQGSKA